MSLVVASLVFVVALAFMTGGSYMLSRALDRVSARYHISLGLMGLITALGADAPEITSAMTALLKGEHDVGVGVVLGSNLFNIAALMGLGAVLAHDLPIRTRPLIFNAVTSLLVTAVAALLLYRVLNPGWAMLILALIFVSYVSILCVEPDRIADLQGASGPTWLLYRLDVMAHAGDEDQRRPKGKKSRGTERWTARKLLLVAVLSLAAIVGGAIYTVQTALIISSALAVPRAVVGSLILAILSSLPNAYTSAHLAREQEGTAVVSETINSNTINIIIGLGLPAVFFGVGTQKVFSLVEIWWLLGMTTAALLLPLHRGRLRRTGGLVLIAAYLIFAGVRICAAA